MIQIIHLNTIYTENEKDESSKSTSENGFRKRNGFLHLIEANNYRLVKFKWKNDDINVIRKKKNHYFFLKMLKKRMYKGFLKVTKLIFTANKKKNLSNIKNFDVVKKYIKLILNFSKI